MFRQLVKHGPLGIIQKGRGVGQGLRETENRTLCACAPYTHTHTHNPRSDRQVGISMHIELFN